MDRNFHGPLTIKDMPVPAPQYEEVLVKIAATGVCHTDLHAAQGDWSVEPSLPFVPGHEGVGGLVHIAIQCARGMGLHVVALDVADDKLADINRVFSDMNAGRIDGRLVMTPQ